jgi:hypothetical protein
MYKPEACFSCPFVKSSTGFVADQTPKLVELSLPTLFALIVRTPTKDDLVEGHYLSSRFGKVIEADFLLPLGIRREQLLISAVLRCYPNAGEFPTGKQRADAVKACRRWDTALEAWKPNIWGVTISPSMLRKAPNQAGFIHRALGRAKAYAEAGYRPALLLGEEAKETYMPWLEGNMKKFQGHWELYNPWEEKAA